MRYFVAGIEILAATGTTGSPDRPVRDMMAGEQNETPAPPVFGDVRGTGVKRLGMSLPGRPGGFKSRVPTFRARLGVTV